MVLYNTKLPKYNIFLHIYVKYYNIITKYEIFFTGNGIILFTNLVSTLGTTYI